MDAIKPSIFGRLSFYNKCLLSVSSEALHVAKGDSVKLIPWREITTPVCFTLGLGGQSVNFSSADKNYHFTRMAYGSKYIFKTRCERYWVKENAPLLEYFLNWVNECANSQFLRQSKIRKLQYLASKELARWLPWVVESPALARVEKKIHLLVKYARWNSNLTRYFQERYIQKQLDLHKLFFDRVESNPLTDRQRRACIIDDDNNLLLAGAGTGKTSVMIGRAGFLVESKQALYKEILLLAYGRQAANELDERIRDKLTTDEIKAATFHRIGLSIISQVERRKPSLSVFVEDEQAKAKWVQTCLENLLNKHGSYRTLILNYFSKYYYVEKNEFDFATLGDYYQYLNDNDIRSLKGDKVKSFGELYIANWLFYHGIDYQYETAYQYQVVTVEHRQYKPDFYLPEYDIYIEYYGIDEEGNTAAYIDKATYHAAIKWKSTTHEQYKTQCITLTYGQHKQGVLLSSLQRNLSTLEVDYQLLPIESILASLKETGRITVLAQLFSQLIGLYKSTCVDDANKSDIIERAEDSKQINKALELLKPILSAYNDYLAARNEIDFEDMISKAINYVESGLYKSPWRYIMVDEFQDISNARARLIKALRDSHKGCSIFAVGDDWQAIYRFNGADLRLTTHFAQYFGYSTQTALDLTFRFNNSIGQVASKFISKNPAQLNKSIISSAKVYLPAVSLLRKANTTIPTDQSTIIEVSSGAIDEVLQAIQIKNSQPVTVYVLARFSFQLPTTADIQKLSVQYPLLTIKAQTFHSSKGKEADYVIIVGLQTGKHGFPSDKTLPAIIDALLPQQDDYLYAEERRLFYVALTRAKQRVYIIADMANASCFVHELVKDHEVELNEFSSASEQAYSGDIQCMRCHTGVLTKQMSRFGLFYSCSLFPRCDHKEQPCSQCASPMTRKRYTGFKFCLNTRCNYIVPLCDKCGAEMVLRNGPKGEFWGCRNYRGNKNSSCKYGKNTSKIRWPELIT